MATCPCLHPQRSFCRRAILRCRDDCCRRNCNTLRRRKLESDAAPLRQRLRRRAILLAGTMVLHRFLISSSNLRIDAAKRSKKGQSVHRFPISGPDLRIDATKRPKQGQSVHRFSISSPDLRIDVAKRSKQGQSVHRFSISSPDFRIEAAKRSKLGYPCSPGAGALCRGRGRPDVQTRPREPSAPGTKKRVPTHR